MPTPATPAGQCIRPEHRNMFVVDIAGYSRRSPDIQLHLRTMLDQIVKDSCDAAGICWERCHHEDRGDGIMVITHADASIDALLGPLITQIRARLCNHNKLASASAQIQLRMGIHAGYTYLDIHGAAGKAVTHLFRLVDAPAQNSPPNLAARNWNDSPHTS